MQATRVALHVADVAVISSNKWHCNMSQTQHVLKVPAVRSALHVAAAPKGQVPFCPKLNEQLQTTR